MVTIPTKYYGTSSMEYGEVDYSGNVVNTPQQLSQPKSSSIQSTVQPFASYVQQPTQYKVSQYQPQSSPIVQQPSSIVSSYDPMQSLSRSPTQVIESAIQKPSEPQYTQLSQRELDVYGIGALDSGPIKAEDDTYIKNKQIQISDYNTRAKAIMNERSISSSGEDIKKLDNERMNIIADISTRPGVQYSEKTNTYLVPVDPDKYNAGNYKTLKLQNLEGDLTTIAFIPTVNKERINAFDPLSEDVGGLGRLKNWFVGGYSDKAGNKEYKNILSSGLEFTEDIQEPKTEDINNKIYGNLPSIPVYGVSGDTKTSISSTSELKKIENENINTIQTKEAELYNKINVIEKDWKNYDKDAADYEKAINSLSTSQDFVDYTNAIKSYDEIVNRYGTDQIAVMSPEDQNKMVELSTTINNKKDALDPKIKDLQIKEKELNTQNQLLTEKTERLQNVLYDIGESKINIQNRDPVKAWKYVLDQRIRSDTTTIPDKVASFVALAPLTGIKTLTRDPIEFLIAAPVSAYQEDKELGRSTQLPTTYLARGIYDWRAEKGERFNPDALSGAITVATVGASGVLGAIAKPAAATTAATTKSIFSAKNLLTAGFILGTPPAIETFNYFMTPAERRPDLITVGENIVGGYGAIGALYGASYVAGKVGAGIGQSVRSADFRTELASKLENRDFEFISYKDSTGKVLKNPIVKGASDEARKRIYAEVLVKSSRGDVIIRMSEKQLRASGNKFMLVGRTNIPKIQYKVIDYTAKQTTKKGLTQVLEGKGTNLERGTVMDFTDNKGWTDLGEGFSTERGIFFNIGGKQGFITKGTALSGAEEQGVQLGQLRTSGYTVFQTAGKNPKYYLIPGRERTGYYSYDIDSTVTTPNFENPVLNPNKGIEARTTVNTGAAIPLSKKQYESLIKGTMSKKEFTKIFESQTAVQFRDLYEANIGDTTTSRYVQSVTESGLPVNTKNVKTIFTGKSATNLGVDDFVVPSGTKVGFDYGMTSQGPGVTKITYNPQGTPKATEVIPSNIGGTLTVDKAGNIRYVIPKSEVSRLGLKDTFSRMLASKKGYSLILNTETGQPVTASLDDAGNIIIKGSSKSVNANQLVFRVNELASTTSPEGVTQLRSMLSEAALPQIIRSSNIRVPAGTTTPITAPTTFTSTESRSGILNLVTPTNKLSPVSDIRGVQELLNSPDQLIRSETGLIGESATSIINEITPISELTPATTPTSVTSLISSPVTITKIDTQYVNEIPPVNEINRVPPITPPPTLIFPPWFGWPEVPNAPTKRRRGVKTTRAINPLADYRVFFKRAFGYYGLPGVSKSVNIYDTSFKDETDVGDFAKKVNKLLGK